MLKKIIAIVILLSLLTIAVVQAMDRQNKQAEQKVEQQTEDKDQFGGLTVGSKAPNFTLHSLDGDEVSLSDYKGKKILVNFWATWCPPCKKEMPAIQQFSKEANEDLVVIAVNIDPENDVVAFANEYKLTFPILLDYQDVDKPVSDNYQVMAIPTTFFIDSEGNIQNKFIGEMKLKDIEVNMNRLK